MEAYIVDWLSLLGRWTHMVVGIAWIGASFYFVWLDNHLQRPVEAADRERGVGGEIWSVHGGGFYHAQKYQVAPPELPETLHWFKWEAYSTWWTGMFLLALLYWYGAEVYLIDPQVAELSKFEAIALGAGAIAAGWLVYDLLCRSALGKRDGVLSAVLLVLLSVAAWGLCQVFGGRGAFMHYGAILGTIMVANVFFVIIPGQRALVEAKREGRVPDAVHGERGKQRSVHNTYFTLPVLFVMICNHYAMTWAHRYNWLVLVALTVMGALVRVYFVARHKGQASVAPLFIAGGILAALLWVLAPSARPAAAALSPDNAAPVDDATVMQVVRTRCMGCHAAAPTQPGFMAPPKGIKLESLAELRTHAVAVYQQAVLTRAMPIGNLTAMTDAERALLARWHDAR